MKYHKFLLGVILFSLGLLGVFSLLTMNIPIPEETAAVLQQQFSAQQIELLKLINPTIILLICISIGLPVFDKANLRVPIIESMLGKKENYNISMLFKQGLLGGLFAGIVLTLVTVAFQPLLPEAFLQLNSSVKPSLAARFLYGGIAEEIMMRFGLMSFLVWLFLKLFKFNDKRASWLGIIIAALIFGFGHFPIAFNAIADPSIGLLTYILLGNSIGGLVFGWLYWKRGLESAILAHIVTHVVMLLGEPWLN